MMVLGMLFLSSLSIADQPVFKGSQVDEKTLAIINTSAQRIINRMGELGIPNFDYSETSVRQLSDLINTDVGKLSERGLEASVIVYGSYFGSAIINRFGGEWMQMEDGEIFIVIDKKLRVQPFNRVAKQLENGEEDSIYSLYLVIDDQLKKLR